MKPETRILVINVHSILNAGDRALLECTLSQLQENFSDPHFIIAANWPDEKYYAQNNLEVVPSPWYCAGTTMARPITRQIIQFFWGWCLAFVYGLMNKQSSKTNWEKLFRAYQQADVVIGVAGNQFYSTGRYGWPLPMTAMSVGLAHLFKKPFYTMPLSLGPLKRKWERWLMRNLFSKARRIQLRDSISLQLAHDIGLDPKKLVYIPDPAFAYTPVPREDALSILHERGFKDGKPAIGATIIANMGRSLPAGQIESYYRTMAEILRRLIKAYSVQICLFIQVSGPSHLENDLLGTEKVKNLMGEDAKRILVIDGSLTPAQLKACYGCMDFFLPSRLHSGIFAMAMGIPCLFFGYLPKTRGLLTQLGLQNWVVDLDHLDIESTWKQVELAWNDRKARAKQLESLMSEIIKASRQAGRVIEEDFKRIAH